MPNRTILLIEPDKISRNSYKKILKALDFNIVDEGSAMQAIKAVDPLTKVILIICNIGSCDNESIETINFLKAHHPNSPIVVLWESPDYPLFQAMSSLGVLKFLSLPTSPRVLLQNVKKLLLQPSVNEPKIHSN